MLDAAWRLDAALRENGSGDPIGQGRLRRDILAAVARSPTPEPSFGTADSVLAWLAGGYRPLRPALGAALPLALGFLIGWGTFPSDDMPAELAWASMSYVDSVDGGYVDDATR